MIISPNPIILIWVANFALKVLREIINHGSIDFAPGSEC